MASLFTRIVNGEIPCHKIAEDDNYLAFLDVRPIKTGHTLVIPKREVDYIFDLDETALSGLMSFAQKVARKLQAKIPCKRVGIMVAGLEVPHCHIHLIPMDAIKDLNFANAKDTSQDELSQVAQQINA